METYNYDDSVVSPEFGPEGDVTPTLPDNSNPVITPGFGPSGDVTPSLPSRPAPCINCGGTIPPSGNTNTVLWTWGMLSPFFSTSSSVAHVRFYNAAAIREPLDIYLNGRLVVSNLEYMAYTNFLHIVPGVYRLTVYRRTNPGFAIIDTGVQFRGGTSYTVAILGTVNDFSVQLISS